MNNTQSIQLVNHHQWNLYEQIEDVCWTRGGVRCDVWVNPENVSILCDNDVDWLVAKSIAKTFTKQPIVRDARLQKYHQEIS